MLVLLVNVWCYYLFFFFNDTATTEIYTLSLHDALPIWMSRSMARRSSQRSSATAGGKRLTISGGRSEEHTSELQSRRDLVCRLLLEKKKKIQSKYQDRQIKKTQTINNTHNNL